ncbi:hypothetical protein DFH09DRAFT_1320854 [Mycena vulgaris]|nr:hypothetical protein DFH09DRAFT_1320854 [Mycena vulgaris]
MRRNHILIGLAQVGAISANLNQARSYCAHELRVPHLCGNGSVLLDLLKSVLLPDASYVPSTPSNPTEAEKIVLATILVMRTKPIWLETYGTVSIGRHAQSGFQEAFGREEAQTRRREEKEAVKDRRSLRERRCAYPGCTNTEAVRRLS